MKRQMHASNRPNDTDASTIILVSVNNCEITNPQTSYSSKIDAKIRLRIFAVVILLKLNR